jgi:hypothetical protein
MSITPMCSCLSSMRSASVNHQRPLRRRIHGEPRQWQHARDEPIFTIHPRGRFAFCAGGIASCTIRSVPNSSIRRAIVPRRCPLRRRTIEPTPALFTSTSRLPNRSTVSATARFRSSLVTSPATRNAPGSAHLAERSPFRAIGRAARPASPTHAQPRQCSPAL